MEGAYSKRRCFAIMGLLEEHQRKNSINHLTLIFYNTKDSSANYLLFTKNKNKKEAPLYPFDLL